MLFAGKTLSSVHCVVSASDSEVSARSKYMFLSLWTSEHLFQRVKPREEKFGSSKRQLFVWCFGDADAQQEAGSWKHLVGTQDAAHQPTLLINTRILIESVSVFFLYLLMWDFFLALCSSHHPIVLLRAHLLCCLNYLSSDHRKRYKLQAPQKFFVLFFLTQRRGRNEFFIFCQRHALQEPTLFAQNHSALDFYPLVSQSARRREIALSSRRKRGPNLQTLKAQRETFPRDLFAQSWMGSYTCLTLFKKERRGGINPGWIQRITLFGCSVTD